MYITHCAKHFLTGETHLLFSETASVKKARRSGSSINNNNRAIERRDAITHPPTSPFTPSSLARGAQLATLSEHRSRKP